MMIPIETTATASFSVPCRADASRRGAGYDPTERPRPSFRDDPPRWDPHRFGSPAPRPVGDIVRGARPGPLREGSVFGPATASGDRAGPRLGAWRDHDVPGSH